MLGDLKIMRDATQLQSFCKSFLFEHPIRKPTYYEDDTPTGIDPIIKKHSKTFYEIMALGTGIQDHNQVIMNICSTFSKGKPKISLNHFYKIIIGWSLKKN